MPRHDPRHGPFIAEALAYFRRPRMTENPRFALLRKPTDPLSKPIAFASLGAAWM